MFDRRSTTGEAAQSKAKIHVLGGVAVEGRPPLTPFQQAMLAVLVSYGGSPIRNETLAAHIWNVDALSEPEAPGAKPAT